MFNLCSNKAEFHNHRDLVPLAFLEINFVFVRLYMEARFHFLKITLSLKTPNF